MQTLFAILLLASLLGILLGLIKPSLVLHWGAKRTRLRAVGWYSLFTVLCVMAIGVSPSIQGFSTGFSEGFKEGMNQQPSEEAKSAPAPAVAETKPAAPVPVMETKPTAPAPVAETAPAKPEKASKTTDEPQPFKIGMDVPVGKFVYTVKSVKFAKRLGNSMTNQTADGVFLLVNMTIRNNDTETRTLDGSLFKIKDTGGTEYEHSSSGSTALMLSGGKPLFLKQCQPKIPTAGILVFEVPDQSSPYVLELSGGYWSRQHAQVALQ